MYLYERANWMNCKKRTNWGSALLGITAATLLMMPIIAQAQDAAKPADKPAAAADKKDAPKKRKKARGRLPAHYTKVVSQKQRTEIYGIQAKYAEQMAALTAQLKELTKTRDAEVAGVLSDEQRAEVEKAKSDAAAARKKKADEKKKK